MVNKRNVQSDNWCPSGFHSRPFNIFINDIDKQIEYTATNLQRFHKKDGDKLFSRACCDRTRCNGSQVKEGRFRLGTRKNSFIMRVGNHWKRLQREVVDAPPWKHSGSGWMGL